MTKPGIAVDCPAPMAKSEFDERLFDLRVVEKNIRSGVISRKDYEKYLKSLEDDDDNAIDVATVLDSSGYTPRSADADEE